MQTQKNIIMWPLNIFDINILIIITAVFSHLIIVLALRDVKVKIPPAVRKGEKAILKCSYDMEGDSIYSVKWYKGRREFYRYTPKETPPMKIFPVAGVRIEHRLSNESQLTLNSVGLIASGKYSCEVSADAPSFHTLISSGELEVVEIPSQKPIITGIRSRYRVGEIVRGNCTSRNSKPAANLTWTINDHEANPSLIRQHKRIHDLRSGGGGGGSGNGGLIIGNSNGGVGGDLEISTSQIQFVITPQHFYRGKLKIRCAAHIHNIYWQSTEKSIEEERPKIISVSNGNSVNLIQTYPYDQYSLQDDDIADKKDYVTHIQGDMSSLNSGTVSLSSTILLSYIKTTATAAAATTAVTTTSSTTLKSTLLFMILCLLYYTIHNCTSSHVYGGDAGSGGILTILSVCYLILCNNNSNSIIILHRILLFIFQLQYNTSNYNDNNVNDDNMQIVNIS